MARNLGRTATALTALALMQAGCSGSTTTSGETPSPSAPTATPTATALAATTVMIDGKERTCDDVIDAGGECYASYQQAFDRWGAGINDYVTSGLLGPLGNNVGTIDTPKSGSLLRYQDVAASGLQACIIAEAGENENDFIDFLLGSYPNTERIAFLPLWFGAHDHLCPEITFASAAPRSGDFVIP